MCGLLGTTKKISTKDFDLALSKIFYRGPDDGGSVCKNGVTLGHRRLSIIDTSKAGYQPMSDEKGDYIIIFNGEIYNYKELKANLITEGEIFSNNSDTEVILVGYKRHGISFFERMRGMWAFAIFDTNLNKIILSRDFFGIKPLYYSNIDSNLSFCSELKPLSSLVSFVPDKEAYKTYFYLGMMVGLKTGIENIHQVLPGEVIEYNISSGELSSKTLDIKSDYVSKYENLESVLSESVRFHYVSDVPVSLLFSGGTDSSIIAALSKKNGFNPTCFFVSMDGNSDKDYANKIARNLGLNTETIDFNEKELEMAYNSVLSKLDMPTSDISILPTFSVFEKIKQKTKVALSGEGGDELFGGYIRHKNLLNTRINRNSLFVPKIHKDNLFGLKYVAPIENRIQSYINWIIRETSSVYSMSSSTIYDPVVIEQNANFLNDLYKKSNLSRTIPDSLFFDLSVYLPYMLMFKADRSSMINSTEARVPFLDKNVFNYVCDYYDHNGLDSFYYKRELKKILEKYLPEELVYRKKQGFGVSNKIFLNKEVRNDFMLAFKFHKEREGLFGNLFLEDLNNQDFYNTLIEKYPRFAFGLITSYKIWVGYGLN